MGKYFLGSESGLTRAALRAGVAGGRWVRLGHDLYRRGSHPPTPLEVSLAAVYATNGVAGGEVAAILCGFERYGSWSPAPDLTLAPGRKTRRAGDGRFRRRDLAPERIVIIDGIRCTDALQTLIDLAACVGDDVWEQALEGALRHGLVTMAVVVDAARVAGDSRARGAGRMRRVLARRPPGAVATGSVLETMAIQMMRLVPQIPTPQRQVAVYDGAGRLVGTPDVAWPDPGAFLELDGQGHEGQPVHDAWRQTAIVAVTGWLPARATWQQVTRSPRATAREVLRVLDQAGRRRRAS